MKFRFFSLLASFLLTASLFAQLPSAKRSANRAQNRAESKVNNKVDRTVDKAVDEVFSGLFGKKKKKKTTDTPTAASTTTTNSSANASQDESDSDHEVIVNEREFSFTMAFTVTKKNGKQESSSIDFSIAKTAVAMQVNDPGNKSTMRMIMDNESGKTTTVTTDKDGSTSAMRMKLPSFGKMANNKVEDYSANVTIERTGERKTIDGYNCEKVIVTDTKKGDVTTAWITQDVDLRWEEMSKALMGFGGGSSNQMPEFNKMAGEIDGFAIKGTTVSKKETVDFHYQNIKYDGNTDLSLFDLKGIEVMEIGF